MLLSLIVLLLLFVSSPSLLSQAVTADDVEKTIASLPPDQRVYERLDRLRPLQQRPNALERRKPISLGKRVPIAASSRTRSPRKVGGS